MRISRAIVPLLAALAIVGSGDAGVRAQARDQPSQASQVRVVPVRGNIWLIVAGTSNVVASIGKDGVMLVDTGSAAMSAPLTSAVQALDREVTSRRMPQQSCVGVVQGCSWWSSATFIGDTVAPPAPKPIVGIVNTSFDADHMGGNAALAAAGRSHVGLAPLNAWIIAHEKVDDAIRASRPPIPVEAQPTETYPDDSYKLNYFNGEGVVLWHLPAAHTSGDTIVQFRQSDVLVAGDILNMTSYPVIDVARGGTVQGVITALNWLLDMAVVEHMMEGGTLIVPGHGRLTDSADVAYYRDMVTIVRDRVKAAIGKGQTLAQIKAAKLTHDYDGRFGRSPSNTPDMFVEAVFTTLTAKP
jgi:glyoxylase-like metal-dependent hydrolase (beta-lactamase superfamily II)